MIDNGILVINKESFKTSRDVVNAVSKILGTKKIGHTGTLDPLATGVLVLCVGKMTKAVELLTATSKEYIATILLGMETDTLDITGTILKKEPVSVTKEEIATVLKTFLGSYEQEVPIYSAVHVNGKRLYEYARNQEKVILPKRVVTIDDIKLLTEPKKNELGVEFQIQCTVSKGTYIRSLIRDIAHQLNTVGCMKTLQRIKQGDFTIEQSQSIEELQQEIKWVPLLPYLKGYKETVNETVEKQIRNGSLLPYEGKEEVIFLNQKQELIAIYKQYEKDKAKIKPWKTFF